MSEASEDAPHAPTSSSEGWEAVYPLRERVFLVLAGVFLASMVCMNVLGITKFIQVGGWTFTIMGEPVTLFQLAIGVLPYPVTFLATDLVSELYGKKRASFLVWVGFGLNVFLLAVCGLGAYLGSAPFDAHGPFYAQAFVAMGGVEGSATAMPPAGAFYGQVWTLMAGATAASMVAYLVAQLCDVHLFHFWKDLTQGKHLWLRNNGSTIVSQLVDTVCVLTITFWTQLSSGEKSVSWLIALICGTYAFKLLVALIDTPLFYLGTYLLKPIVGEADSYPEPSSETVAG
jgi:queuosine precursor transporter